MRKVNNVIKCDKDRCTGCGRCLNICPVPKAISIKHMDNGIKISETNESKCIGCGKCVRECVYTAREFSDNSKEMLKSIKGLEDIHIIISPSLKIYMGENFFKFMEWLKQYSNVKGIYDGGYGGDIFFWANYKLIKDKVMDRVISSTCPSVTSYILKHKPQLQTHLSCVYTPMSCMGVYLRKYHKIKDKIAIISPCISDMQDVKRSNVIDYYSNIDNLIKMIDIDNIGYNSKFEFTNGESMGGDLYMYPNGFKEEMLWLDDKLYITNGNGANSVYNQINCFTNTNIVKEFFPNIVDLMECEYGCVSCGDINSSQDILNVWDNMYKSKNKINERGKRQRYRMFDKTLKAKDFCIQYRSEFVGDIEEIDITNKDVVYDKTLDMTSDKKRGDTIVQFKKAYSGVMMSLENVGNKIKNIDIINKRCIKNIEKMSEQIEVLDKSLRDIVKATKSTGALKETEKDNNKRLIAFSTSVQQAHLGSIGRGFADKMQEETEKLSSPIQKTDINISSYIVQIERVVDYIGLIIRDLQKNSVDTSNDIDISINIAKEIEACVSNIDSLSMTLTYIDKNLRN